MNKATSSRPEWADKIQIGDNLKIRDEYLTRGGQWGEVISIADEGVGLDFFCDVNRNPTGVPSQEFWEWMEIDPDVLPTHAQPVGQPPVAN